MCAYERGMELQDRMLRFFFSYIYYFLSFCVISKWVLNVNTIFLFIFSFHIQTTRKKGAKIVAYSERTQERNESRQIQLIREYGFNPRSKVQVEDGALLPRKFEPFPDNMYGKPLEEIDQFIYEEVSQKIMWHNFTRD